MTLRLQTISHALTDELNSILGGNTLVKLRSTGAIAIGLAIILLTTGCGAVATPSPLKAARVAPTPLRGQLSAVATSADPVGEITPVYVSVANGRGVPCATDPS